jgi:hypothetical protein
MTEQELHYLLMGYLDGELDEAERARVEAALEGDAALRRELDEMRRLKELTAGLAVDSHTDAELDAFWSDVYNRLERSTAWILLVLGFTGVVAAVGYLFFTHPGTHWSIKAAAACGLAGSLLLLWSVWRERRRVLPHDEKSDAPLKPLQEIQHAGNNEIQIGWERLPIGISVGLHVRPLVVEVQRQAAERFGVTHGVSPGSAPPVVPTSCAASRSVTDSSASLTVSLTFRVPLTI